MRKFLVGVFLVAAVASAVRADSIDDAEAKRRGVSVEVVQLEHARAAISRLTAEVSKLEAENATLRKKVEELSHSMPPAQTQAAEKAVGKSADSLASLGPTYAAYRNAAYASRLADLRHEVAQAEKEYSAESGRYGSPGATESAARAQKTVQAASAGLRLLQQAGPKKYVPTLSASPQVGEGGVTRGAIVFQRINDSTALVDLGGGITVEVTGISFVNVADGAYITFEKPMLATKTVTYPTAMGSMKTVILLEPFDPTQFEKY